MRIQILVFLYILNSINVFSQFSPEKVILSANIAPTNISGFVISDVNDDSTLDLITISQSSDEVSVFPNNGINLIPQKLLIDDTCNGPSYISAGDVDNDGDDDFVVVVQTDDQVVLYLNNGDGNFTKQILGSGLNNPLGCHVADLNQDGKLDVLAALHTDDKIVWFENLGGASFGSAQTITTLTNGALFVTTGDLDMDGDLDVISASTVDDKVAWYENLGMGSFGPQQIITTSLDFPKSISIADVDLDNDLDLVVLSNSGIGCMLNDGSVTFSPPQMVFISGYLLSTSNILLQDLNGDLYPDLVATGSVSNTLVAFENTGGGLFGTAHVITAGLKGANFIRCVDYNNDGTVDVVASGSISGRVEWFENLGGFSFSKNNIITTFIFGSSSVYAAKIDDDNYPDIITAGKFDDNIGINFQSANSQFEQQKTLYDNHQSAESIDVADFDGDGDLDVVSVGDYINLVWFENLGNGELSDTNIISSDNVSSWSVVAADLDSDGDIDVLTSKYGGGQQVVWFENDGAGNFIAEHQVTTLIDNMRGIYTGDLDNDGDQDIVLASSGDNKVAWYENLGGGNFGAQNILSTSAYNVQSVFIADLDNDGLSDIISASMNDDKIAWYKNTGSGFSTQIIISTNADGAFFVRGADLDMDGDIDLFSCDYNGNKVRWYENLGTGTFTAHLVGTSVTQPKEAVASDIDLDGDLDIVTAVSGQQGVSWFENLIYSPNQARGRIYYDENENGIFDGVDYGFDLIQATTNPLNAFAFTYSDGRFFINFNDTAYGTYEVFPDLLPYWGITTDSLLYHVTVDSLFNYADSLDFGFYPDTLVNQLSNELTVSGSGCSQQAVFWINIQNQGTTYPSGIIHIEMDTNLVFSNATIPPDSISGHNLYWSFDSLYYFESSVFSFWVEMPDFTLMGDTLWTHVNTFILDTGGDTLYQTVDSIDQVITCAYDPNDKICFPAGVDSLGYIPSDTPYLDYTIRFQNTGTDTAFNVIITDQLDLNLDWSSIIPLGASDPVEISCSNTGILTFSFENIMLPDSNVNEPQSHGFVKYRIYIHSGTPVGTNIHNNAEIYFDFNPPIITNTTTQTLFDCELPIEQAIIPLSICKNEVFQTNFPEISLLTIDWNINDFVSGSGNDVIWTADTIGSFNLDLSFETSFCLFDTTIVINVQCPLPVQSVEAFTVCAGDSVLFVDQYYSIPGSYIDTLSSNITGCDSLVELLLLNYPELPLLDGGEIEFCSGDSVLLNGQYYELPGIYYDTLQNSIGCDSIVYVELVVNDAPSVSIISTGNDTLCIYENTLTLVSIPAGGNYYGPGILGDSFNPNLAGVGVHNIVYLFTDLQGCYSSDTIQLTVDNCLGLNETELNKIVVYPNPFNDRITITNSTLVNGTYTIRFFDVQGNLVHHELWNSETVIEVQTDHWDSGNYFGYITTTDLLQPITVVLLVKE